MVGRMKPQNCSKHSAPLLNANRRLSEPVIKPGPGAPRRRASMLAQPCLAKIVWEGCLRKEWEF